jgi:amidohydrolase
MLDPWEQELDRIVDRRFDDFVAIRRHLHMHPEVSREERESSLYLYQRLGDEGFEVRLGPDGRGVIANSLLPDLLELPLIALRADIDALRIHDEKSVSYRSQCDGVMHACGHDAHTAIVFATIVALEELQRREFLPWPIRFRAIFQPAEETSQGAKEMIEVGAMEDVVAILSTHMDPRFPVGSIGLRENVLTANCDEIKFQITGRGGHAARPHEASDPIAAAAHLLNALYLFVPRATDSQDAVVMTIGQITGGHTANVIPEEVALRGTLRTLEEAVRKSTLRHIERLAAGIGTTSDTQIQVSLGECTFSVVNDPELIDLVRRSVTGIQPPIGVHEIPRPSMGSEDFAFYLPHAPGAMIRIGCRSEQVGGSPLHSPNFDIDEEAIRVGARVLTRAVVSWSNPDRTQNSSLGLEPNDQ